MTNLAIGCGIADIPALGRQHDSSGPAAFPVVAFDAADPDRYALPFEMPLAQANSRYGTLIITDFQYPSLPAANRYVLRSAAGGPAISVHLQTNGQLAVTLRHAANTTILLTPVITAATPHTIMLAWDTEQATIGAGTTLCIDGATQAAATFAWNGGAGAIVQYANMSGITYTIGGSSAVPGHSSNFSGQLGLLALDCTRRLDIADSAVRDALLPENIGVSGENGFGRIPELFVTGNAAQWNSEDGINWGISAEFTAFAGAAVTNISGDAWPRS
jgi:hypothetical protein